MTAFRVGHRYSAVYRSRPIAFDAGAAVEVDDDVAAWVNNDSPGCLVPAGTRATKPEPEVDDTDTEAPDEAPTPKRGRRAGA